MPATKISIDNAKKDKLFYFVANAHVYRTCDDGIGRCLILKRDPREVAHPGRYATPGGKYEWGDMDLSNPGRINGDVLDYPNAVEDLLRREIREEAGIEVGDDWHYVCSVGFVRPDETPVVLIKLAVEYKSGDVVIEKGSFTDYAWVTPEEIDAQGLDCVDGMKEEIAKVIASYR